MNAVNTEDVDLFTKGCAYRLRTSAWGARKKFPIENITTGQESNKLFKVSRCLVHPDRINPIFSLRSQAWSFLKSRSVDINIDGVVFIPYAFYIEVEEKLQEYRTRFFDLVTDFELGYEDHINEARSYLGKWFDIKDYPYDVGNTFDFQWASFTFAPPKNGAVQLDPSQYKAAESRFNNLMDDLCTNATISLRKQFMELITGLTDRLSGSSGKGFRSSNIEKLTSFIDRFRHLNIAGDTELESLIDTTQSLISGVTSEEVRNDDMFRNAIASEMQKVQASMYPLMKKRVRKLVI